MAPMWYPRRVTGPSNRERQIRSLAMNVPHRLLWVSFVAGLTVASVIFVIGYQLLFPALCAIDGMVWAAWAQVVAILLVGVVAGGIAYGQFKTLRETLLLSIKTTRFSTKTTKMQNAIALGNEVYQKMTIGGVEISPMDATGEIHKTRYAPGALQTFRKAYGKILNNEAMPGDELDAERVSYAIAAVNNYFGGMHLILKTGTVDKDFILDRFSRLCLEAYTDVVELAAPPPREEFYEMARASYGYMKARGQTAVAPPEPYTITYLRSENS
jgi:hypothetical protein